jgi:hypothetical protein
MKTQPINGLIVFVPWMVLDVKSRVLVGFFFNDTDNFQTVLKSMEFCIISGTTEKK